MLIPSGSRKKRFQKIGTRHIMLCLKNDFKAEKKKKTKIKYPNPASSTFALYYICWLGLPLRTRLEASKRRAPPVNYETKYLWTRTKRTGHFWVFRSGLRLTTAAAGDFSLCTAAADKPEAEENVLMKTVFNYARAHTRTHVLYMYAGCF